MRRLFTALALVALPVSAACGGDAATSEPVPVIAESSTPLLVDSLPELTGPTVLWFWAPG